MNKLLALLLLAFPVVVMADSSMSFTPPASDFSVVFLGDIFGVVDGVLHGTGSQIMGSMFGVFNAAVLALGGIIIMYTLLVSTMNTAHEGQMLGQKWSSIWIPVRSVAGLALLMPKASGYCLMQIFVMWIVVQGVGAADKVWEAALSYLNRGGAIVQAQIDPTKALMGNAGGSEIAAGAQIMLAGQVCMLGLHSQLEDLLRTYQKQKSSNTGPCYDATTPTHDPSEPFKSFCNSTVPDFISTVNFVAKQTKEGDGASPYDIDMPNIKEGPYQFLSGVCGKIKWNAISTTSLSTVRANLPTVSEDDLKTVKLSRAIALQQLYTDLTSLAQVMVSNNPSLAVNQTGLTTSPNFSIVAKQQFGIPQTAAGNACIDSTTPKCILWGSNPTTSANKTAPLLNGTEFQNAIADYNAIMLPTLNLVRQAQSQSTASDSRKFIIDANTEGWIMAGSYFFDLINLNVQANSAGDLIDEGTGLKQSTFDVSALTRMYGSRTNPTCNDNSVLCNLTNKNADVIMPIVTMITGYVPADSNTVPIASPPLEIIDLAKSHPVIFGLASSTVLGYTSNATVLQLPGQPGMQPLQFANMMNISIDTSEFQLPEGNFPCGTLKIMFWSTCLGSMFGELLYNDILRPIYNHFLTLFQAVFTQVLMMFLVYPLQGIATIFKQGLAIISQPGVNPVVALANMGTYYINFTVNLWQQILEQSLLASMIPGFGLFVFVMIGMAMPLLLAWLGVMVSIGFTTAYYVPILPYMIFTFGSIAWLLAVIEAMVAAPIVALGVTHPEGHDAFGKGEQAVMILLNVFLRPSMMIIGYISAIAVSYVSVWIINAGFDHAIGFVQGSSQFNTTNNAIETNSGSVTGGYTGWAGIYAYFFSVLVYTTMYLTVVTKAFTLISVLPDKVLRWIGGQAESAGSDSAQWAGDVEKKVGEGGKDTLAGQKAMDKKIAGKLGEDSAEAEESGGGNVSSSGKKNKGNTPPAAA